MDGAFTGTIVPWAATFAPRDWQFCYGQELRISQYSQLFSIIGTQYGGNGKDTFKLPDFRDRSIIGAVPPNTNLPERTPYLTGEMGGVEVARLSSVPPHTHTYNTQLTTSLTAVAGQGDTPTPGAEKSLAAGWVPGARGARVPVNRYVTPEQVRQAGKSPQKLGGVIMPAISEVKVESKGTAEPESFSTLPPVIGIHFIICLRGIFPSYE